MERFKVTKTEPKVGYESPEDDDGEGTTVTSSLLEMKELNGPHYEGMSSLVSITCFNLYRYSQFDNA